MLRSFLITAMLMAFFLSCNKKQESKQQYYPVRFYIEQELAMIDSFHLPIKKYEHNNMNSDSTIINISAFRALVKELLLNDLSSSDALDSYEETTINDLQLDFVTLSYTSTEKNISKIELHIDPKNERVKSLYAEKNTKKNESIIIKKILLTSGSQLLINTLTNTNNSIEKRTEFYSWSLNHPK